MRRSTSLAITSPTAPTSRSRSCGTMPTSATAGTRRPDTATPSTTVGTSWSSSTATVSTRPRRCPTCWRRSPTMRVDAVFGSRMLDPGGARRGGMPLYKFVGNRILTRTQNVIAGVRLSEWHSGYRAYRVSALADLPFVGNSDGFDFDTEIILQLLGSHRRIVEVPIPTYYGDEISRVNGIAYARDIVIDTVRHRLGEVGLRPRRPRAQGRALRLQAVARQLARHRARSRPRRRTAAGARRRVRARLGGRRAAPPRPSRHGGRPDRRRGSRPSGPTASSRPTSSRACPTRWAAGSTW